MKRKNKLQNFEKSLLSLKIASKAQNIQKIPVPLKIIPGAFRMIERSRIFKKVLSAEISRQN